MISYLSCHDEDFSCFLGRWSTLTHLFKAREDESSIGILMPCFVFLFILPHFYPSMGLPLCSVCSKCHQTMLCCLFLIGIMGFDLDVTLTRPRHIFTIRPDFHVSVYPLPLPSKHLICTERLLQSVAAS